ncbi:hypothetical protein BHM03_00019100 [Ensete ventricosum]|nr:hypothetical protein BHM03_00019100 [Ensete ventricosum]
MDAPRDDHRLSENMNGNSCGEAEGRLSKWPWPYPAPISAAEIADEYSHKFYMSRLCAQQRKDHCHCRSQNITSDLSAESTSKVLCSPSQQRAIATTAIQGPPPINNNYAKPQMPLTSPLPFLLFLSHQSPASCCP